MAQYARVYLKSDPTKNESVIPVKGYNLLKKKYVLVGYEDQDGGELTAVQKIMAEKVAKKKAAEAVEKGKVDETQVPESTKPQADTASEDAELEGLRTQYKQKFGKAANKNSTAKTLKAKLNEG